MNIKVGSIFPENSIYLYNDGIMKKTITTSLFSKKNVIVISPLIALMEDQRKKLNEKGINTISFNSSNSFDSFNKKKTELIKSQKCGQNKQEEQNQD